MRERISVAILAAEVNATTSNVDIYLCNPYLALRRHDARVQRLPIKDIVAFNVTMLANPIVTFNEHRILFSDLSFELNNFHVSFKQPESLFCEFFRSFCHLRRNPFNHFLILFFGNSHFILSGEHFGRRMNAIIQNSCTAAKEPSRCASAS